MHRSKRKFPYEDPEKEREFQEFKKQYENSKTMAEFVPYMTVKEEDFMEVDHWGEGDYNEKKDEYYTPEGFYEWQSETDTHWKISAKVTHVMPLFQLP